MKKNDDVSSELKFLANTLHEIRTPIQTIIGSAKLLSETNLDKEQKEYVHQIKFGSDVLCSLANDILDISKMKSDNFTLEEIPFDLHLLIEQVVDLISIEAFNKGLEIVTDIDKNVPKKVKGDPTRVQQILLNIIKNAVKFTENGYIQIAVSKNNSNILFEVIDSGLGIPEKKRKKLFTDFYQADTSTARKYGGSGLGLSICKNLVSLMKGSIGVSANKYGGSIFWFKLALKECNTFCKTSLHRTKNMSKILIVDDSLLAAKSLQYKLETEGFINSSIVLNGNEALTSLEYAKKLRCPFNLVFIDMIMPSMDGWRLASDITAKPEIKNTKLFLMVPEGQMGADAKMKILNWFDGYIYKPIKMKNLLESLNSIEEPLELESIDDLSTSIIQKDKQTQLINKKKFNIIIAEDHPINRKILVSFLKKLGYSPFEAENGKQVIKIISQHDNINLIFMDIQMPVLDGLETTKQIRANGYKGLIIACTANNDISDINEYKRLGMDDVVVKPFKVQTIKDIIKKWEISAS